ncbi:hypothetical protein EP073_08920 [Geovibrio thiophilus]|uniref:Fe/B12 periplasmic-binding domain-containing protein n=1 Tax=Geovibrio thiophilus TaxID=139438 RepID=A0A3R5YZS1_9BACT|nr:ABC transporter substrate-binding protein [Geovibrio thiophilus]QAR33517.1 hypothetical protein EP073_08920 [Geovibrio thiophilus]
MMRKLSAVCLLLLISVFSVFADETSGDKVWGATVPSVFMIYIVNPDILAGWSYKFYPYEEKFISEKYKSLPFLGGWHNEGGIPDREMLMREKVKRAFIISSSSHNVNQMIPELRKMGIETFTMKGSDMNDYIVMLRELGRELSVPERGEELAAYSEKAVEKTKEMTKGLKDSEKLRVYVAGGKNGLRSGCNYEELALSGVINALECLSPDMRGAQQVSFEQIVAMNPDVVLITDPFFGYGYKKDSRWKRLRAYKTNRIFVVPYGPFGWMEKPAVMKFMAVQWLTCNMYPEKCTVDIKSETKNFMKLFLHLDLTDAQVEEMLRQ